MFAAIFALTAPPAHTEVLPATPAVPTEMYADCDAVRAAGAAPLRMGQPGYRAGLDANMNGVACETVGQQAPSPGSDAPSAAPPIPVESQPEPAAPPPPPPPPNQTQAQPELTALT